METVLIFAGVVVTSVVGPIALELVKQWREDRKEAKNTISALVDRIELLEKARARRVQRNPRVRRAPRVRR